MRDSWRVFGLGGVFAYVGRFSSAALGTYSAYVTDPSRTVVLRYGEPGAVVVVSPDRPAAFVEEVLVRSGRQD
jgi:hypothetical protein